jgi:hypothetical protein
MNAVPASVEDIVSAFERQATYCRLREASVTASLIDAAALCIRSGGALAPLVADFDEDPAKGALALRIAGALHFLHLKGRALRIARCYETLDAIDAGAAQDGLNALVASERDVFETFIANPPQTNEINRAAALVPAFSEVARRHGLPLDLYELGASGGLLLAPDYCRIDYGRFVWGDGTIALTSEWRGATAPLVDALDIGLRLGCDRKPVDYSDPEQLLVAHSFIWPEHPGRRAAFGRAVTATATAGGRVEQADALTWLGERNLPRKGAASVVFTSVFAVYLSDEDHEEMERIVAGFGALASDAAPVALIQFEPEEGADFIRFHVDLTMWPGGERRRVVEAQAHGQWVRWAA